MCKSSQPRIVSYMRIPLVHLQPDTDALEYVALAVTVPFCKKSSIIVSGKAVMSYNYKYCIDKS